MKKTCVRGVRASRECEGGDISPFPLATFFEKLTKDSWAGHPVL
jgi:hypothetical protein